MFTRPDMNLPAVRSSDDGALQGYLFFEPHNDRI
jgi:hypothetical protein